ncbi:glutamine amidotransferase class-II [Ferrimonas balearica DSM 9799]|uniref:Glutamine amidotransferase class-II n=1 Tax=Ferrimonas balearica (strain DSM 9799 / CCM 4581 / KCTC 23876 / PAT) TaxID=550540 RepID=E1SLA9_FERBD|nr:class II glutamine amidotransferase [Ferrimonas balearica]ADN76473.1 glutamine amidotransferase class-II [Ferrimonas balearica DSM 9799]MBW3139373.1 class II glutamine amidotransferase [Ferrimonas balearica]MBW3163038.1 class II glutamine amidotransferase [Ferrimonas balearica]MBY5980730.1 class II glutamine amidotransferase [Ferrimonas balearica]MBY6106441.1 class II glutamine amidotransferase [Ferrimonas balearica]
MCELLAMSANVPTDIVFSFTGLVERGGKTGPHRDGWGITFYDGPGNRTFKDSDPSCHSEVASLLKSYPIKSKTVVSHIRQANRGRVCLENTHPFGRELWGRNWCFAHNGQLSDYKTVLQPERFLPVGNTDSELAFCTLMDKLAARYPKPPKDRKQAFRFLAREGRKLQQLGVFNMLISDGVYLLALCGNNLHWITRQAPFGEARLIDTEMVIDFQQETTPKDVVTVIATRPLTSNEAWHKMEAGSWCLFREGKVVAQG